MPAHRPYIQPLLTTISALLTVAALYLFGTTIAAQWSEITSSLGQIIQLKWLILTEVILMLLNILTEAKRWQTLINTRDISLLRCLQITLCATALSNTTPAGLGEHIARTRSTPNTRSTLAKSFIASALQTITITAFALISLLFIEEFWQLKAVALCIVGGSVIFYIIVRKNSKLTRFVKEQISNLSRTTLLKALLINALRYVIFAYQLSLLLTLSPSLAHPVVALIPIYYFVITILPGLHLLDIGIKGSAALLLFSDHVTTTQIGTATIAIWIINIIIPSAIGIAMWLIQSALNKKIA